MHTFDVIVVGGGVVGLSAAIAMQQRGFSVAIIDAGDLDANTATSSRVYAINHASRQLLSALELWTDIDSSRLSPYTHMHVWDASNKAHIDFDARMIATNELGMIIEESAIKQAALAKAQSLGIAFFPQSRVTAVQSNNTGIELRTDNQLWQSKLLIVADGAQSATRQLLGVSVTSWPYHQNAIVATITTEHPHQQTAYQVFNPDGPLAFLPLVDNHQCSIVWSTSPARAAQLMALEDDEFSYQLNCAFNAKLGVCRVQGTRHQYPLHMRHTKQYSGSNWLLMGDAAHTIHPLAGLGLNVGLDDLRVWLSQLDANKAHTWSNKMLQAYQRQRKHAVWQTIALMGGLKTLFANPLPAITALRGIGLSACNNLSPLKRLFIQHAAGTEIDEVL